MGLFSPTEGQQQYAEGVLGTHLPMSQRVPLVQEGRASMLGPDEDPRLLAQQMRRSIPSFVTGTAGLLLAPSVLQRLLKTTEAVRNRSRAGALSSAAVDAIFSGNEMLSPEKSRDLGTLLSPKFGTSPVPSGGGQVPGVPHRVTAELIRDHVDEMARRGATVSEQLSAIQREYPVIGKTLREFNPRTPEQLVKNFDYINRAIVRPGDVDRYVQQVVLPYSPSPQMAAESLHEAATGLKELYPAQATSRVDEGLKALRILQREDPVGNALSRARGGVSDVNRMLLTSPLNAKGGVGRAAAKLMSPAGILLLAAPLLGALHGNVRHRQKRLEHLLSRTNSDIEEMSSLREGDTERLRSLAGSLDREDQIPFHPRRLLSPAALLTALSG